MLNRRQFIVGTAALGAGVSTPIYAMDAPQPAPEDTVRVFLMGEDGPIAFTDVPTHIETLEGRMRATFDEITFTASGEPLDVKGLAVDFGLGEPIAIHKENFYLCDGDTLTFSDFRLSVS